MTLETTVARIGTVLDSVAAVGNVHIDPRIGIDRDEAEAQLLTGTDPLRTVNAWEVRTTPEELWAGCDGATRTEVAVQIRAWWGLDDEAASRAAFVLALRAVCSALMDPTTGFAQIDEGGARATIDEQPRKLRTGHAAWTATIAFRLLDTETT